MQCFEQTSGFSFQKPEKCQIILVISLSSSLPVLSWITVVCQRCLKASNTRPHFHLDWRVICQGQGQKLVASSHAVTCFVPPKFSPVLFLLNLLLCSVHLGLELVQGLGCPVLEFVKL